MRFLFSRALPPLLFLLGMVSGCGPSGELPVDKVEVIQGDNQYAPPSTECFEELRIEFLSPKVRGLLGGKGARRPVPGVEPVLDLEDDSDVRVEFLDLVSDAGGRIRAKVFTGKSVGDHYFSISAKGYPAVKSSFRVTTGISISGDEQEGLCGTMLPKPISVTVYDSEGNPVSGTKVFFKVSSHPDKREQTAKIGTPVAVTDETGTASTRFKLGGKTGRYIITAEIADRSSGVNLRGIDIPVYGKDIFGLSGLVITVLGGLAIFIFGMKSMTDGLQLVAGDKMKSILRFFTSNRFIAILAGATVTGVIQSSSACTVMVVGFVNAGLLSLRQAIGIIFGANIGTTVTAQMLSFKISHYAMIAIIAGLLLMMLSRRITLRGWGRAVMGFGLLFFGMSIMSGELKMIAKFPSIVNFFSHFDCSPVDGGSMSIYPILGAVLIGTGMTVVIQSSSATIGIALALASSGLINFYTAVPLILGDNIGTTVTANLAALAANRRSKQTAVAHFLFNAFGTAYMLLLFFIPWNNKPVYLALIDWITPGNVFADVPENINRHIAMAHTMFNVFNVLLFLPLIGLIERVCRFLIPIRDESALKLQALEPHLLNTPSIAIEQAIRSLRGMTEEAWDMVSKSVEKALLKGKSDKALLTELAEREDRVDALQLEITDYLVKLTTRHLTEPQSEIIPLIMHCTNDAERVADHTANILELNKRLIKSKHKFSDTAREELNAVWSILQNQARHVISALRNTDSKVVMVAHQDEARLNQLTDEYEKNHIARLKKGKCKPQVGVIYIELLAELEKVGDHLANIADRAPDIQKHHLEL